MTSEVKTIGSEPPYTTSYTYNANGNQITRDIHSGELEGYYELSYDAENRLVEVKKDGAVIASFVYDGDGKQVKATVSGVTTIYVGSHYEIEGNVVTKYYFAGASRIAMNKGGTLSYILSDHLGSSSVVTDSSGTVTASMLYGAWGGTRYSIGSLNTKYEYTGQRNEAGIGLHFYNARGMTLILTTSPSLTPLYQTHTTPKTGTGSPMSEIILSDITIRQDIARAEMAKPLIAMASHMIPILLKAAGKGILILAMVEGLR